MNTDQRQSALFRAIYRLLRPLARLLLRNGIPYGVFADIAKRAFLEVAMHECKVEGRKQTDSRVATITGLTRKEVARLKNHLEEPDENAAIEKHNRAARVVYGWVHDRTYADADGQALALPLDGEGPTFNQLVKKYSGDMPPRAILDELLSAGVVQKCDNQRYLLRERAYIPEKSDTEKLRILGQDVAGLIATIEHNINGQTTDRLFQRKIFYDNLPEEAIAPLRHWLSEHGQRFLETVDVKVSGQDRDVNPKIKGTGRKGVGFGLYYFEENSSQEEK